MQPPLDPHDPATIGHRTREKRYELSVCPSGIHDRAIDRAPVQGHSLLQGLSLYIGFEVLI